MSKRKNTNRTSGKTVITWVVGVLVLVLVVGLALFNSISGKGILLRAKTAAKSDNYSLSGTEMAYFSGNAYQQMGYLGNTGIDTSKSLKDQKCPFMEDGTWFDYFMNRAKSSVQRMLALCEYAHENGIKLDSADKETIKSSLDELAETAAKSRLTADGYLKALFGNGFNTKDLKNTMELSILADKASSAFIDSVDLTREAEAAYYEKNPEAFNGVDYYTYTVTVSSSEEADADANADAAVAAIGFATALSNVDNGDDFKALVRSYEATLKEDADEAALDAKADATFRTHVLRSSVSDKEMRDWIFSAKVGEAKTFTDLEHGTYTVVLLDKPEYRDETVNRAVRHILLEADKDNAEDDSAAKDVLDQLKAENFSEEAWKELAEKYSKDTGSSMNGGLYEEMVKGTTYTEFNDWLFDDERQVGDSGIVKTQAGWHIMYYVGEADSEAWMVTADEAITNEEYSNMIEEYSKSVEFNDNVIDTIAFN